MSHHQIVIFTAQGCKYCEKAKNLLKQHKLPFTPLDVDFFPDRYKQAADFTKVSTVPLIFFGNELVKDGSAGLEKELPSLLMKSQNSNGLDDEGTSLSFLSLPLSAEELRAQEAGIAKRETESDFLSKNNFSSDLTFIEPTSRITFTYSQLLNFLRYNKDTAVPLEDKGIIFKCYKVVRVQQIVEGIEKFFKSVGINSDSSANSQQQQLARKLVAVLASPRVQMIYNKDTTLSFGDGKSTKTEDTSSPIISDDNMYFRFAVDAAGNGDFGSDRKILNAHRNVSSFQQKDEEPLDFVAAAENLPSSSSLTSSALSFRNLTSEQAVALSRALWRVQDDLCNDFRDKETGLVDYSVLYRDIKKQQNPHSFASHPNWTKFKNLAAFLQLVDLSKMSDKEKIAFGINIYNTAVYCAFFEFFVPWSNMQKLSFFGGVGFLIGKNQQHFFFSLNDLENGFLRGNRKGVMDFFGNPLSSSDPRCALKVQHVDYRIHFGLNCGAKSCPPVKVFSSENLDQELELAAQSFIQSNSTYNATTNKIATSQILKWYKEDFEQPSQGHNTQDVVLKYLFSGDSVKREEILKKNGGQSSNIGLEFTNYDWSFNAKKE